jgi:hypothetical protein
MSPCTNEVYSSRRFPNDQSYQVSADAVADYQVRDETSRIDNVYVDDEADAR